MIHGLEGAGPAVRARRSRSRIRHFFASSGRSRRGIRLAVPSFVAGALLLACAVQAAPAQGPDTTVLTLEQALARSEEASGLVRRARAEREVVAARDVGASLLLPSNPVLSGSAGPRHEDDPGGRLAGTSYAFHLEQALEVAGQRGTRRAEVARAVEVARWREALARAEIHARVRAAYVGAQLAEALIQAARRRVELVQQMVDSVQTRVHAGAASSVDLQLARVERGRAVRERLTAELAKASALAELRLLVGAAPERPVEVTTQVAQPAAPAPLTKLLALARAQRAELKVLAASHDQVDAAIVRLKREAIPSPTLFLDVQRDLPGQLYVGGGVAVPLPFWRRNQGELAVARAERARLDTENDATEREIEGEVAAAYQGLAANVQIVQTLENDVLPAAEAAVELTTEGWRAGKFDLFRVIQASREASDARRNQLESLGALWQAAIAVDRATGAP
jgi:cobalt-zinc-cadmium efflux system outer membrane protein